MMAIPTGCKEVCPLACWTFSFMGKYLTGLREDFDCESVCKSLLDMHEQVAPVLNKAIT